WGDRGGFQKEIKARKLFPQQDNEIAVDGLWMIALGRYGFVGLTALWAAMLLPPARFLWAYPARQWTHPALAPGAAATVVVVLFMIDCLFNALYNPVYVLMAGGVAGAAGPGVMWEEPAPAGGPGPVPVPAPGQPGA